MGNFFQFDVTHPCYCSHAGAWEREKKFYPFLLKIPLVSQELSANNPLKITPPIQQTLLIRLCRIRKSRTIM